MKTRITSILLTLAMFFSLAVPALAEDLPATEEILSAEPVFEVPVYEEIPATEAPVFEEPPAAEDSAYVGTAEEPVYIEILVQELPAAEESSLVDTFPSEETPAVEEESLIVADPSESVPSASAGTPADADAVPLTEGAAYEEVESPDEPEDASEPPADEQDDPAEISLSSLEDSSALSAGPSVISGTCGENLSWTIDKTGTLTISGNGPMYDSEAPWVSWLSGGNIARLVIKDGVTHIGAFAFNNNTFEEISLASSVTSIGKMAFGNSSRLKKVFIPASVSVIEEGIFAFSKALQQIDVEPDNPHFRVQDGVLFSMDMTRLLFCPVWKEGDNYTVPSGVTSLDMASFFQTNLKRVILPEGITEIPSQCFLGSTLLTSVQIPASVYRLEDGCFCDTGIKEFTVSANVREIGSCFLRYAENIWVEPGNPVFSSVDGVLYNKDQTALIQYPNGRHSTEYQIPDGVISIQNNAFWSAYQLKSLVLPQSVSQIGDNCFGGMYDSQRYLLSTVKYLGDSEHWSLVNVHSNNTVLNNAALITEDTNPSGTYGPNISWRLDTDGVLTLDGSGEMQEPEFYEDGTGRDTGTGTESTYPWHPFRKAVRKIIISSGITSISAYAFRFSNAEELVLPDGLKNISPMAFNQNYYLSKTAIPDTVECIGEYAFISTAISSFTVPAGTVMIGDGAFCSSNLQSITVAPGNSRYFTDRNGIFYDTRHSGYLYREDGTTHYENELTLLNCPVSLAGDYTVTDQVAIIAPYAFNFCSQLSSVILPSSVKGIGHWAFNRNLKNLCFSGSAPFISGRALSSLKSIEIYYRPDETWTDDILRDYGAGNVNWHASLFFSDVADSSRYYYTPVYWAVENNITVGYGGPNLFSPDAPCTREQIVTFLWRLMDQPKPLDYNRSFVDVPSDKWYYESIMWAASTGITTGYADGSNKFGVGDPCTREQCVTFLWRAAGNPAPTGYSDFTDVSSYSYYYDSVSWAAANNITVGLNDGTGRFGVGRSCTRAMIVTFLYRFRGI